MTKSVPGQELAHQLRGLADRRVRGDRVVAGGHLEVVPRGEDVLREDRAGATRHGEDERDAGDRPVLDPLGAGRPDDGDAARLEVEHREALRVAHQRLGARTGGEAHLDPAGGVRRAEERLRPRRVVTVREDRLGAVHRERLRVGHEPADRELEVPPLLDRALGHHARSPGLRADEERERVERRVARDADRRLELVEPAPRRLGGVGREEGRALLEIRHVRLVAGIAPGAELLERHHQLDRVEHPDDAGELCRRQAAGQADELLAWDVDVDEHPGDPLVRQRHRLDRDLEVEPVGDEKPVDDVELGRRPAVEARHDAVLDPQLGLGVGRAVGGDETELGPRLDEQLTPQLRPFARDEAAATARLSHGSAGFGRRRRLPPRARRRRSASRPARRGAPPSASSCSAVERPGRRAV